MDAGTGTVTVGIEATAATSPARRLVEEMMVLAGHVAAALAAEAWPALIPIQLHTPAHIHIDIYPDTVAHIDLISMCGPARDPDAMLRPP